MYLSRLTLNPRSRQARHDLGDCQQLHRRVMTLFPATSNGAARAELAILYRVETDPRSGLSSLMIQSRVSPSWPGLPPGYALDTGGAPPNPHAKAVGAAYASIRVGQELVFRLRANPTRKIDTKSGPDGARRNGKRVELRREADQIGWLARKAADGGFELGSVRVKPSVPDVRAIPDVKLTGRRPIAAQGPGPFSMRLTFGSVLFEGLLRVADADRFRVTLEQGIGPGKAYGFGLLSIGPVRG